MRTEEYRRISAELVDSGGLKMMYLVSKIVLRRRQKLNRISARPTSKCRGKFQKNFEKFSFCECFREVFARFLRVLGQNLQVSRRFEAVFERFGAVLRARSALRETKYCGVGRGPPC